MEAEIYDANGAYVETLYGYYATGNFYYKRISQQKVIHFVMNLISAEFKIPCNMKKTQKANVRRAVYEFNGTDYIQLDPFADLKGSNVEKAKDNMYNTYTDLGDLAIKLSLKQPISLLDIVKYLGIIMSIIFIISGLVYMVVLANGIKSNLQPFNKSVNLAASACAFQANQLPILLKEQNETLQVLNELKTQGG